MAGAASVQALITDGTTLYVGGYGIDPIRALNLTTGAAVGGWTTPSFDAGADDQIYCFAVDSSGLYVGGSFADVAGSARGLVCKLNKATGALDGTFAATTGFNSPPTQLTIFSSALYACGYFTTYNGSARTYVAKINATSSALDGTFVTAGTGFDNTVTGMALSGSDMYVAGIFVSFNGSSRIGIAKLNNSTGALDGTFLPGAVAFHDIQQQNMPSGCLLVGGKLVVIGYFMAYQGHSALGIAVVDTSSAAMSNQYTPI
jgi:hypothetical protein